METYLLRMGGFRWVLSDIPYQSQRWSRRT